MQNRENVGGEGEVTLSTDCLPAVASITVSLNPTYDRGKWGWGCMEFGLLHLILIYFMQKKVVFECCHKYLSSALLLCHSQVLCNLNTTNFKFHPSTSLNKPYDVCAIIILGGVVISQSSKKGATEWRIQFVLTAFKDTAALIAWWTKKYHLIPV